MEDFKQGECPVCLNMTFYKIPSCRHYLCLRCSRSMIINQNLCPLCRTVRNDLCVGCGYIKAICGCDYSLRFGALRFHIGDYVTLDILLPYVNVNYFYRLRVKRIIETNNPEEPFMYELENIVGEVIHGSPFRGVRIFLIC